MTIAITGGTKEIKISYIKYPSDVVYYDSVSITGITGTFTAGEIVTGGTSNATATVYEVGADYLYLTSRDGVFQDAETITGATSGATATQSGSISTLPQVLTWTTKYKYLLSEACALIWKRMKGANDVAETSQVVDNLIDMLSELNRGREETEWSTY